MQEGETKHDDLLDKMLNGKDPVTGMSAVIQSLYIRLTYLIANRSEA